MGVYTKNVWADNDPTKPLSAARMTVMEDGIFKAHATNESALPGSPYDGQEIFYAADATNGVYWHLRYRTAATTYKWEYVGGGILLAEVAAQETTTSSAYTDLTTVGPSVTAPLAGIYEIGFGVQYSNNTTPQNVQVAPKIGSAATADADNILHSSGVNAGRSSDARVLRKTLAASDLIKLQYKIAGGGTGTYLNRWLYLRPFKVG